MATDDDSDVPESGGVFTFGKSKFADNAPSKFWVRNDRVAEVACGDEHTALVAESGRIFTFGANDWGQLGLGDTKVRTKPSCIKSLKSEKIRAVACGRSSTYVATESGRVYSCGGNSEGQLGQGAQDTSVPKPARIEGLPDCKVKMLTAGADHAALLTEDGEVYMWGSGSEGQLGLGDVDECPTPKVLDMDEKVTCISAGYYHTALCTESGDLYTFGESENGKLGLGEDPEETNRPQKVSGISGRVNIVACGGSHTVAITTTGKVYTFGDGAHGQLGHGNIQLQATTPQEVSSLRDSKIVSAACGENHTALISDKGVLFTFGNGRHGKLGLGEENFANQFKPSAVTRFGAFTVERVACGGCHMLILARPKLQNGEASSAESEQEEAEEVKPTKQLELLRRSDDLDLSGSFSARNRRREKQRLMDPSASMSRTLPPLNSSISGRVLPPLSSSFTANSTENPLNKSMLPPLKKPDASSSEDRKKDSDLKETTEESTESEERKDPIKKESQDTLRAAPVPAPRFSPRLSSQPKPRILHVAEQEKRDNSEDSDDSEPKKSAIKPLKQINTKASPIPRPRFGVKVTPPDAAGSEDDSDEDDDKKKKNDKPSFRKQKSESEDSESEDDSRKKKEADRKKENEKKKKDKSRVKKQGGLFGKKKILDSDDEDSESESEESSDKDKRSKAKKFQSNSEKKERNKKGKDKKDKKKSKVESEEEESSEEGDKKNKSNKKSKKESEEEEESSDEKEEKKNGKIKEKEKEPEPEKKPEKKTKICTLL